MGHRPTLIYHLFAGANGGLYRHKVARWLISLMCLPQQLSVEGKKE